MDKVDYNRYQKPVITEDGRRINYSREQLEEAKADVPLGRASSDFDLMDSLEFDPIPVPIDDPLYFQMRKKLGIFGTGIGDTGITTGDFDEDSKVEIILGGGTATFGANNFINILEYDAGKNTYEIVWQSKVFENSITRTTLLDLDGDGKFSIVVCLSNCDIEIYAPQTYQIIRKISSNIPNIKQVLLVDADNDSSPELVIGNDNLIRLYTPESFVLELQISNGGDDLQVGNRN